MRGPADRPRARTPTRAAPAPAARCCASSSPTREADASAPLSPPSGPGALLAADRPGPRGAGGPRARRPAHVRRVRRGDERVQAIVASA